MPVNNVSPTRTGNTRWALATLLCMKDTRIMTTRNRTMYQHICIVCQGVQWTPEPTRKTGMCYTCSRGKKALPGRRRFPHICTVCHQTQWTQKRTRKTDMCYTCSRSQGRTDLERFWACVDKEIPCQCHLFEDRCWIWTGRLFQASGYGSFTVDHAPVSAHRFIYVAEHGPLPPEVFVLHEPPCTLKHCIRHLYAGTHTQNMHDAVLMHRHKAGEDTNMAVTTTAEVLAMRADHASGMTIAAIARKYGRSQDIAGRAIRRRTWKHI